MATDETSTTSTAAATTSTDTSLFQPGGQFDASLDWRAILRTHWRNTVPGLYTPRTNSRFYNPVVDEVAVRQQLLDVMENFIFQKSYAEVLAELSQSEKPHVLCGRVFKNGEPTYSCRDCGMDPTCVLCVDCFKTSAHRVHRYKMSTSGGGGYCDCGDREAWKESHCCSMHATVEKEEKEGEGSLSKPLDRLPPDLLAKARMVIQVALEYCFELLTWEKSVVLPEDLKLPTADVSDPPPDVFVTMLFNDEVHTYEEVIRSLEKSIDCTKKEATDYATAVDREGRCIVRCAPFSVCNQVKEKVERITSHRSPNPKPLRLTVMDVTLVAHQSFALRLLGWLHQLIQPCQAFRILFSECVTDRSSASTTSEAPRVVAGHPHILQGIMEYDTHLWKTARSQWHQLLISGMLLEPTSKKDFAKAFVANYPQLLTDFVVDDHEHVLSITSLSVQIFTVPTLAHMLIAEDDVLATLLRTFNMQCRPKLNADGRLAFERHHHAPHNTSGNGFRRAQFVLCDLRYLLISKPENWSQSLRRNFLHGFSNLLELLGYMQGMDATVRQLGQHMEFEPEWESAFHLYIRLSFVLTLVTEWCGSNRDVLVRAYKATLRRLAALHPRPSQAAMTVHDVAGHSVTCVLHDVSSQPISIHLPLSRLLAALHLHLERYDLNFASPEFAFPELPTPAMLIEMPLRALAMIAQVHANMWRRNGYSVVNQIYFYQNVKCRQEMYDRDVVLLQAGAALMGGDKFVARVLHKFGLTAWARDGYETEPAAAGGVRGTAAEPEDGCRQVITLVEEFLGLLLVVVGERHVPGVGRVTEEDRIRKEIIQQLCIEPMAHSQLTKTLSEDCNHETGLEAVIDQVATFRKPPANAVSGKGLYVLKPELYAEYNPFFYHYSREEQSKAEETQRRRKKAAFEDECCPPPIPPLLCTTFAPLVDILCCDVTLHVMRLVLERSLNLRARTFSEMIFQKLLNLIGYALHEEKRVLDAEESQQLQEPQQQQQRTLPFEFTKRASEVKILELMEQSCSNQRVESHRDLLNHTVRRFKQVQRMRAMSRATATRSLVTGEGEAALDGSVPMEVVEEDVATVEENVEDEAAAVKAAKVEKQRRAKVAADRRARILEQMAAMQKNFIRGNADLFEKESGLAEASGGGLSGSAMDLTEQPAEVEGELPVEESPICIGPHKSMRQWIPNRHTCILCQEEHVVSADSKPLVLSALVQKSTVLSKRRGKLIAKPQEYDPLLPPSDLACAPHVSTCGHVMHADCWGKYFDLVLTKERRRSLRMRYHLSFDVEKREFLCPLCECLSNTVIPIVPALGTLVSDLADDKADMSMNDWIDVLELSLRQALVLNFDDIPKSTEAKPPGAMLEARPPKMRVDPISVEDLCKSIQDPKVAATVSRIYVEPSESDMELKFSDVFVESMKHFAMAPYMIGLGVDEHSEDDRLALMTFRACAHTIHTVENLLRDSGKPLFGNLTSRQSDCLSVLVRFAATCAQHINRESALHTHCYRLVRAILHGEFELVTVDTFGYLVSLVYLLPHLLSRRTWAVSSGVPVGQELMALKLLYSLHVLQIIMTIPPDEVTDGTFHCDEELYEAQEDEDCPFTLLTLFVSVNLRGLKATMPEDGPPRRVVIERRVKERSIPFLRCCALFFHYLSGIKAPDSLTSLPSDEYDSLCHYLGLTNDFSFMLESTGIRNLTKTWLSHRNLSYMAIFKGMYEIKFPHAVNQLWPLPDDYSELINAVSQFTCPNSEGEDSRAPALCLVCGDMFCSQSYCCQSELDGTLVGACTQHAHGCGAGVGMFLRVRECKIVLLASKFKGCFIAPPYLDQYGETDQGLKRGNPLHISHENYRKLHKLWLSHGIPEEIAHSLETNAHMTSGEWQIF